MGISIPKTPSRKAVDLKCLILNISLRSCWLVRLLNCGFSSLFYPFHCLVAAFVAALEVLVSPLLVVRKHPLVLLNHCFLSSKPCFFSRDARCIPLLLKGSLPYYPVSFLSSLHKSWKETYLIQFTRGF